MADFSGEQSPEYTAVRGGMLVDNGTLYKFNGSTTPLGQIDSVCDNRVFAFDSAEDLDDEVIICSTSFGVAIDSGQLSPRLLNGRHWRIRNNATDVFGNRWSTFTT